MTKGYSIQIDVEGLSELQKAFNASPQVVGKSLADAVNTTARYIEGKAKSLAPIRVGALRGSIHTDEAKASLGLDMKATVGTDLKYAPYQEFGVKPFGTRTAKSLIMKDNSGNVIRFFKRSRGFAGKFYMKQSREQGVPIFSNEINQAIKNIISFLAR